MSTDKNTCANCGVELSLESLADAMFSSAGTPARRVGPIEEVEVSVEADMAKRGGTILLNLQRPIAPDHLLPDTQQLGIKLPPRLKTGTRLRLRGAGSDGCDLYVVIREKAAQLCFICQARGEPTR